MTTFDWSFLAVVILILCVWVLPSSSWTGMAPTRGRVFSSLLLVFLFCFFCAMASCNDESSAAEKTKAKEIESAYNRGWQDAYERYVCGGKKC